MLEFPEALRAWGTPEFEVVLKRELAAQSAQLPLHRALSHSNHVSDEPITVMLHRIEEQGTHILVKAGIFFRGMLVGCSCADDPSPPGESDEYCELLLEIDRTTFHARATLVE